MEEDLSCPFCAAKIDTAYYYCPNCGKKLREKSLSTDLKSQVLLYLVSLLLPPFGIGSTIRYIKSPDPKAKQVGIISLIMTIVAFIIISWLTITYTKNLTVKLNEAMNGSQLY